MRDLLCHILPHVDDRSSTFGQSTVRGWLDEAFDRLRSLGLLRPAAPAATTACPICADGHEEEVIRLPQEDGSHAYFIHCNAHLRVAIDPDNLRCWEIDLDRLARSIATAVGATGTFQSLIPGVLWRLGKVAWQSAKREALFARCISTSDAAATVTRIETYSRPILFVAHHLPPEEIWKKHRTAVVALSHVARIGAGGFEIDPVELLSTVVESDEAMRMAESRARDRPSLEKTIRRQIKAEAKSHLTDDVFCQAYRATSSVRKAADLLTRQTGTTVTKDRVYAALSRCGGVAFVLNARNSDSIIRPVASQQRDKRGKTILNAQPDLEQ